MTTETARKDAYRREMEEDLLKPQWEQCCGQFELREGTKGRSNSMHFLFPLQYVAKKVYDFNFGLEEGEVYIFPSGMIKEGCGGILPVYEVGKRYNFMNGVKMFLQRYMTKVESLSFNQVLPHGSVIVITSSRLQDFKHATNSKVREVQGVCVWRRCEKGNFIEILKSAGEAFMIAEDTRWSLKELVPSNRIWVFLLALVQELVKKPNLKDIINVYVTRNYDHPDCYKYFFLGFRYAQYIPEGFRYIKPGLVGTKPGNQYPMYYGSKKRTFRLNVMVNRLFPPRANGISLNSNRQKGQYTGDIDRQTKAWLDVFPLPPYFILFCAP